MRKRGFAVLILIVLLLLSPLVLANVDSEIKKITHYAEEYETGNINYVKLMLHLSSAREGLNEILGATGREIGGVVKQEKIKEILGEPVEETKWVWSEGEEHDIKLDNSVPVWKKIVFDGKKIQIRLNAWPSIFSKKEFKEGPEESEDFEELRGKLIYRLNFEIDFKKPEEQLDIQDKIDNIQSLAEIFSANPSSENAEALARESVNAEKIFENYFRQSGGKCEDLMKSVFGSENQREDQKLLVQETSFCEGDNFEIIARLEMCDDCKWNWINFDFWIEGRGPRFKPLKEEQTETFPQEIFKDKDDAYFKEEIIKIINEVKRLCAEEDFAAIMFLKNKLWPLNEAWNQKSNDVWKDVDKEFQKNNGNVAENNLNNQNNLIVENEISEENNQNNIIVENTITGSFITGYTINEESPEQKDPYYWIKQDRERRQREKELRNQNYEKRKEFFLNLFSGYDVKEYYFEQVEWEKRLVEEFKEFGEEICDNNQDDNNNEKTDCEDEQCGGKICGREEIEVTNEIEVESESENLTEKKIETFTVVRDLYCISQICQAKEETIKKEISICGNHKCEENETIENCQEDCSSCPQHPAINCPEGGKVIFKGKDENGCPLEPVCIEKQICESNDDCEFLCGEGECIEGECKVLELTTCEEEKCTEGATKVKECTIDNSKSTIIVEICEEGIWKKTGVDCLTEEAQEESEEVIVEEDIVGAECMVKEDCGGEDDVCSNGKCVTIPQVIVVDEEQLPLQPSEEEGEEQPESTQEPSTEPETTPEPSPEPPPEPAPEPSPEPPSEQESSPESSPEPLPEPAPETTGAVIFAFFRGIFNSIAQASKITGAAITGFQTEDSGTEPPPESSSEPPSEPETSPEPPPETNQELPPEPEGEQPPPQEQPPINEPGEPGMQPEQPYEEHWEDDYREEDKRRQEENKERCQKDCVRPCVEKCIRENCGEEMDCDIDEESKKCETECSPEESCIEKCMKGEEDWWKEFEDQGERKEEKGVFNVGGNCRTSQGKTEGFLWFGGWGDPFEKIQSLKSKYYQGMGADWCKHEIENLIKQRQEFEKGFNQQFAIWFFEKYLANSAEDWEQSVSGIFELYWNNVDNQMRLSHNMQCLEKDDVTELMDVNLISIEYETDYGKLKYWEELKTVKMPGMDKKVTVISPYMEIWIFPSKEFFKYEMQEAMKNHEFPGPPEEKMERKNQEGPTEEEKEMIRKDKELMREIREATEKYGGTLDFVIQFKDYESGEIVFNLYSQINEKDIMKIEPMLPEEVPAEDVRVEIDFEIMYDIILTSEKEMRGAHIESPPWDKKIQPIRKIKETVNGVKMWFKMRKMMNSAKYYPADAEKDVKDIFKTFFKGMMGPGREDRGPPSEKEIEEMKEQGRKKAEEMGVELSDEDLEKFEDMGKRGELDEEGIKRHLTGKAVFEKI